MPYPAPHTRVRITTTSPPAAQPQGYTQPERPAPRPISLLELARESTANLTQDLASAKAAGYPHYPSPLYVAMEVELERRAHWLEDWSGLSQY